MKNEQKRQSKKERLANIKPKKLTHEQKIQRRQELASTFPERGNVRAEQLAAFWGIGVSTLQKYIADGRVKKPIKFGNRVAVWSAEYGHEIAKTGIPAKAGEAA